MTMKGHVCAIAAMVAAAATATAGTADKPRQAHGSGCVEPGVEARCLVLKDMRTGTLYNLLFKGSQPQIADGIEFTGVLYGGVTMCTQGVAVDVIEWARNESLKCAQGEAPKPSPYPSQRTGWLCAPLTDLRTSAKMNGDAQFGQHGGFCGQGLGGHLR
jgi:hypothetical protein